MPSGVVAGIVSVHGPARRGGPWPGSAPRGCRRAAYRRHPSDAIGRQIVAGRRASRPPGRSGSSSCPSTLKLCPAAAVGGGFDTAVLTSSGRPPHDIEVAEARQLLPSPFGHDARCRRRRRAGSRSRAVSWTGIVTVTAPSELDAPAARLGTDRLPTRSWSAGPFCAIRGQVVPGGRGLPGGTSPWFLTVSIMEAGAWRRRGGGFDTAVMTRSGRATCTVVAEARQLFPSSFSATDAGVVGAGKQIVGAQWRGGWNRQRDHPAGVRGADNEARHPATARQRDVTAIFRRSIERW